MHKLSPRNSDSGRSQPIRTQIVFMQILMRFQCKCSSSANKLDPERHFPISLHLVGSWDSLVSEIYIKQSESQRLQDGKNGNQVRPIRFRKDKVSPKLNWKKSQTRNLGIPLEFFAPRPSASADFAKNTKAITFSAPHLHFIYLEFPIECA